MVGYRFITIIHVIDHRYVIVCSPRTMAQPQKCTLYGETALVAQISIKCALCVVLVVSAMSAAC